MKLLIVESPGKVKKLQEYLGSDWQIQASVGHVRDLPEHGLGVEPPEFTPEYTPTERGAGVLAKLAGIVKNAEDVYLATDPDREGEAIAWHLAEALHLREPKRVAYAEITEKAVTAALAAPRQIDMDLVFAQEGRRVLDRLCGYLVSGPLSNAAGERLSAGRVQSPAVRLVVEREREITNFKPTTHYGVQLEFDGGWKAFWRPWLAPEQEYFLDKAVAEKVAALRSLHVVSCVESESRTSPPAPFITSSLQQAASNTLKFNPKKTMDLAQKLYEQGHITYMRTDSPNLSDEAVSELREYCQAKDWPVVKKTRVWKSKSGAQEAHEAIRPTVILLETAGTTDDEQALYALIRQRVLACQLEDAVYAVRTLQMAGDVEGKKAEFEAKGRTLTAQGWKTIMAADQTDDPDHEQDPDNPVPAIAADTEVTATEGSLQTKKTKAPPRYTEATLVKELERKGIGRPSTYAAILDTIIHGRGYVKQEKRYLLPTETGEKVVDRLRGSFSFIDYGFTKDMERGLDDIAEGSASYLKLVADAYAKLQEELKTFIAAHAVPCPQCESPLKRIKSKNDTYFWGCSAYPECKVTFPDKNGKPDFTEPKAGGSCTCGNGTLFQKKGANGLFWGCSAYPECKKTYPDNNGKPDFEAQNRAGVSEIHKCMSCGRGLRRIQNRSDKTFFWGCSGYTFGDCKKTYPDHDGKPDYSKKD